MLDANSLAKAAAADSLRHLGCTVLLAAGVLLAALGVWAGSSYFEAAAYERVTGQKVSTWDAMWVELRVQAGPKD